MNNEFQTVAWLSDHNGTTRQVPVTVTYELEGGYKPLGLWVSDEQGVDITCAMTEAEYDVLYYKACQQTAEMIGELK